MRQHAHRQEEPGLAGNPAGAVERQSAAGDHAMQVRVMQQVRSPGVEHGEEADLRTQVCGIGGYGA